MQDSGSDSAKVQPAPNTLQAENDANFAFPERKYSIQSAKVAPAPLGPPAVKNEIVRRDSFKVAPAPEDDIESNSKSKVSSSACISQASYEIPKRRSSSERWIKVQALVEFLKLHDNSKSDPDEEPRKGHKQWKKNMNLGPVPRIVDRVSKDQKSVKKARKSKKKGCREIGRKVVESHAYEIAIIVITFIALFMEDVETFILTSTFRHGQQYDAVIMPIFSAMRVTAFVIFLLDLIAGSAFKLNYNCKLIWWLDFVSAVSMLPLETFAGEDGNYMHALKAFKVARGTRLLKMLRVVRLAKVVRLLRVINLSKKKVNEEESTFYIGDEEEYNMGGQVNADHLKEQLTTVITVKVLLVILMLMFGLPLFDLFLGDSCYNLEKTNTIVIKGMEQLDILFSNTRFYDNSTHCDQDPLCRSGVKMFRQVLRPYLELYVSNITLAGKRWCELSEPACTAPDLPSSPSTFFSHMCFVVDHNLQRTNCVGCEEMGNCCPDCDVCAPCFGASPGNASMALRYYSFTVDPSMIIRAEAQNSMLQIVILVLILLMFIFIFRRNANRISEDLAEPVKILAREMERVSHLHFEHKGKVTSSMYEIAKIENSFAVMKAMLQSFAKFVPREVVRFLVMKGLDAHLNMQYRELTIFFSDIASFTTICESLRAQELYLLLSSYFEEMVKIILKSDGTLIEYIGDAILAVWNAPMEMEDHACLAICSTLLMQERLHVLREEWKYTVYRSYEKVPDFQVRCGLHTDGSFVGNMGSPARMKYGVAGSCSATAGMLEELNKTYDTRILVSERTYGHTAVQEKVLCRLIDYALAEDDDGEMSVDREAYEKEKNETMVVEMNSAQHPSKLLKKVIAVYEPLGLRSDGDIVAEAIAQLHDQAFELYRERLFSKAAEKFAQAGRLCRENPDRSISAKASAVLHRRCVQFVLDPPPRDWELLGPV